jgi:superfamily II DNA or RNA helicase
MDQDEKRVKESLGLDFGRCGGGESDCVWLRLQLMIQRIQRLFGNKFFVSIFDEVHHLASPGYMQIAEMCIAPYRMDLTATYERSDQRHTLLPLLVGDPVYSVSVEELTAGKHLSNYTYEKLTVELTPEEQKTYDSEMAVFRRFLAERRLVLKSPLDFQRFIMTTGRDPQAREALLARNRAIKIAVNSEAKLELLAEELEEYSDEKILIFPLYNDLVYTVSRRFLIPAITHQTPREERRQILSNFGNGAYKVIVTLKF